MLLMNTMCKVKERNLPTIRKLLDSKNICFNKGCKWCNDPDEGVKGFPAGGDPNSIVVGCIKFDAECRDPRNR